MENHRRRWIWVGLAALLFILAALLMFTGQGDDAAIAQEPSVEFPRRMRSQDRLRADQRRTFIMPVDAGTRAEGPPRPRDPVLAALPRGEGHTAVVIEANAVRNSPLGELLMDCLMRDGGKPLDEFRRVSGLDPLQDLDRIVITDEGLILSGNFAKARFKELLGERTSADYGQGARVYEPGAMSVPLADGGTMRGQMGSSVGTWNDQMMVVGRSSDSVKTVIDRMEGRGSDEPPAISENSTYGEMYGVLGVEQMAKILAADQPELAQRLRDVAQNVELHMDTRSDVALVAEIRGPDAEKVTDLGKSLGAALSVARLKAQAQDDKTLAQLMDFARVEPDGNSFKLEMAVPIDVIRERLAWCRQPPDTTDAGQ
ncbi:hypothetical protein DRW03_08195 [Corallococcus sp. H22C18031201]|uniref:hypothetical protein n=1 Tax=Citreicoccus inhibens TaxID=2849499 RepID=UPI000E715466|nr:hypothetical protein [Citreicoccus inhibens]MBU8894488.1 hypothetical protein [Citreicoccus inhibens]RJS25091.1 hypothetical protein DRW03_08195 [Corallococcus sp. H22C18031201]